MGRFLAFVDLLGTTYTASTLATGYGAHIAQPLLRRAVEGREDTIDAEEAQKILEQSMQVLFYRDARSLDKVCVSMKYMGYCSFGGSIKLLRLLQRASKSPSRASWRRAGRLRRAFGDMERKRSNTVLLKAEREWSLPL